MKQFEYMRIIPLAMLPSAIMHQYNLTPLVHNGHIYVKI
jgi:hypothetical protein